MRLRSILAVTLSIVAFSSVAQDVVRIKYIPGYPPPDVSSEAVEIEVTRLPAYRRSRELDVDRFFAAVDKILSEHQVSANWERAKVDSPFVRVDIALGGKKLSLGSSYSANGLDTFPDQDGVNERHRRALEAFFGSQLSESRQRHLCND